MEQPVEQLRKVLSKQDVLALSFGTMVGWGWIMLSAKWVSTAGVWGAIFAFLLGALLCICVGLAYAELTASLPLAGGVMVFTYRGLGYPFAWFTSWAIVFAYIGVSAWESIAISTAIDYIFPIPKVGYLWTLAGYDVYFSWSIIGIGLSVLLTFLNLRGMKYSAVFQILATIGMVAIGLSFLFGGVALGNTQFAMPKLTSSHGLISVLLMTPSMYVGFDVVSEFAEEIDFPLKVIGKVLLISIFLAAGWYILMITGISLSAPMQVRNLANIAAADSMSYAFGSPLAGKILILCGLLGILTSWNGFVLAGTRILFAMGRAKMIPPVFGQVHPKTKTPTYPIILVGTITCLAPLLGKNAFVWFVNVSSFCTVLTYLMVSLSFLQLRRREPNLKRPYKAVGGCLSGVIAVVVSLFFLSLYFPFIAGSQTGSHEWGMILGWSLLGIIFAFWSSKSFGKISQIERELLIFGEKYARKL